MNLKIFFEIFYSGTSCTLALAAKRSGLPSAVAKFCNPAKFVSHRWGLPLFRKKFQKKIIIFNILSALITIPTPGFRVKINLLPKSLGFRKNYFIWGPLTILLLVISLIVVWHVSLERKISMVDREYSFLQKELKKIQAKVAASNAEKPRVNLVQEIINNFDEIRVQQQHLVNILDTLNQGIMRSLFVVGLSIKDKAVTLTGKTRFMHDLVQLFGRLNNGGVRDITISHPIKLKDAYYEFELRWNVNPNIS